MSSTPQIPLRTTVLCGNPRPASRTLDVASRVADALWALAPDGSPAPHVVDLALLAPVLFASDRDVRADVDAALAAVSGSDLLVVATPVYKGSYSGLLKAFLDFLPYGALRGTVAVPLTVMAQPHHALAGDVHLRPLLVELGAGVPTAGVVVTESDLDAGPDRWVATHARTAVGSALLAQQQREDALA